MTECTKSRLTSRWKLIHSGRYLAGDVNLADGYESDTESSSGSSRDTDSMADQYLEEVYAGDPEQGEGGVGGGAEDGLQDGGVEERRGEGETSEEGRQTEEIEEEGYLEPSAYKQEKEGDPNIPTADERPCDRSEEKAARVAAEPHGPEQSVAESTTGRQPSGTELCRELDEIESASDAGVVLTGRDGVHEDHVTSSEGHVTSRDEEEGDKKMEEMEHGEEAAVGGRPKQQGVGQGDGTADRTYQSPEEATETVDVATTTSAADSHEHPTIDLRLHVPVPTSSTSLTTSIQSGTHPQTTSIQSGTHPQTTSIPSGTHSQTTSTPSGTHSQTTSGTHPQTTSGTHPQASSIHVQHDTTGPTFGPSGPDTNTQLGKHDTMEDTTRDAEEPVTFASQGTQEFTPEVDPSVLMGVQEEEAAPNGDLSDSGSDDEGGLPDGLDETLVEEGALHEHNVHRTVVTNVGAGREQSSDKEEEKEMERTICAGSSDSEGIDSTSELPARVHEEQDSHHGAQPPLTSLAGAAGGLLSAEAGHGSEGYAEESSDAEKPLLQDEEAVGKAKLSEEEESNGSNGRAKVMFMKGTDVGIHFRWSYWEDREARVELEEERREEGEREAVEGSWIEAVPMLTLALISRRSRHRAGVYMYVYTQYILFTERSRVRRLVSCVSVTKTDSLLAVCTSVRKTDMQSVSCGVLRRRTVC